MVMILSSSTQCSKLVRPGAPRGLKQRRSPLFEKLPEDACVSLEQASRFGMRFTGKKRFNLLKFTL